MQPCPELRGYPAVVLDREFAGSGGSIQPYPALLYPKFCPTTPVRHPKFKHARGALHRQMACMTGAPSYPTPAPNPGRIPISTGVANPVGFARPRTTILTMPRSSHQGTLVKSALLPAFRVTIINRAEIEDQNSRHTRRTVLNGIGIFGMVSAYKRGSRVMARCISQT